MIFTEVPNRDLFDKGRWWMPHAIRVAVREGYPPQSYIDEAMRGDVRIFVFWDADGKPTGALATKFWLRDDGARVGELYWIAGRGVLRTLPAWLPRIKQILIRDHAITCLQVTGREGWVRTLSSLGFRRRKVILEQGVGE